MKHTLSVLVENQSGVLSRIAGLFSRRGYNIESLNVGATEDPTISRMTIVVNGDDAIIEQVEKQLNKLINVIKVKSIAPAELINRELILVKVSAGHKERGEISNITQIMGAHIIDISRATLTVEFCNTPEQIAILLSLLRPYNIRETIRTGTVAIEQGSTTIK